MEMVLTGVLLAGSAACAYRDAAEGNAIAAALWGWTAGVLTCVFLYDLYRELVKRDSTPNSL